MDSGGIWRLRLPVAQEPEPPPADDLLSQEDEETRTAIAHYLHLADRLLATDTTREDDEGSAA